MIRSGYDFLKSQVLSCWRKVESVCDVVISSDRVYQTRDPATVNARSLTVERLTGTIRRLVPPERNVRRPGRSATGTSGPRYRGALPCKTLYRIGNGRYYFNTKRVSFWTTVYISAAAKQLPYCEPDLIKYFQWLYFSTYWSASTG